LEDSPLISFRTAPFHGKGFGEADAYLDRPSVSVTDPPLLLARIPIELAKFSWIRPSVVLSISSKARCQREVELRKRHQENY
jgi:hypothetical protein